MQIGRDLPLLGWPESPHWPAYRGLALAIAAASCDDHSPPVHAPLPTPKALAHCRSVDEAATVQKHPSSLPRTAQEKRESAPTRVFHWLPKRSQLTLLQTLDARQRRGRSNAEAPVSELIVDLLVGMI